MSKQNELEKLWQTMASIEKEIKAETSKPMDKRNIPFLKSAYAEMDKLKKAYEKGTGLPTDPVSSGVLADRATLKRLAGEMNKDEHPTKENME